LERSIDKEPAIRAQAIYGLVRVANPDAAQAINPEESEDEDEEDYEEEEDDDAQSLRVWKRIRYLLMSDESAFVSFPPSFRPIRHRIPFIAKYEDLPSLISLL
jgi:hypothetical protein